MAVFNRAVKSSCDAAYEDATSDGGIGEGEVFHRAIHAAEKTVFVGLHISINNFIDADAADGMALAVEGAVEVAVPVFGVVADGGEVVLVAVGVPCGLGVVGDVVGQHEVLVSEDMAAVHQLCHSRQLLRSGNVERRLGSIVPRNVRGAVPNGLCLQPGIETHQGDKAHHCKDVKSFHKHICIKKMNKFSI